MIEELLKYNCSTLFILKPVVGVALDVLDDFGIINSYLQDKDREDLMGYDLLFALFKPIDFDNFELFLEHQVKNNPSYLEDYDYAGGYVVVVYKIPEVLEEDFARFKRGKYSKITRMMRDSYPKEIRINLKRVPSFQWEVFTKSPRLREELENFFGVELERGVELWSIPNIEKETLKIEEINKQYGQGNATNESIERNRE